MTSIFDAEQHQRRTRHACYSRIQIYFSTQSTAKLVRQRCHAFFSYSVGCESPKKVHVEQLGDILILFYLGISRLVEEGVYCAAYPLHVVSFYELLLREKLNLFWLNKRNYTQLSESDGELAIKQASVSGQSEATFSISLVLKVRIFGTRKWPFQKQFLAPTVVQRMQFCQYIFQIISENHIFLRVLPNYHQTGTKTLMDQKKTD